MSEGHKQRSLRIKPISATDVSAFRILALMVTSPANLELNGCCNTASGYVYSSPYCGT